MQRLTEDARDRKLVRTMIDMAHDLGFRVVAEGVEAEEVYGFLKSWECDEAQGFWIARPMPAFEFAQWFRARQASVVNSGAVRRNTGISLRV
jgi:EAL domain-containing protein (putative c-di-GMP-specific phosphodiesterase class I)